MREHQVTGARGARRAWPGTARRGVRVTHAEVRRAGRDDGSALRIRAVVQLGTLLPADVRVHVAPRGNAASCESDPGALRLWSVQSYRNGAFVFEATALDREIGAAADAEDLVVRVRPAHGGRALAASRAVAALRLPRDSRSGDGAIAAAGSPAECRPLLLTQREALTPAAPAPRRVAGPSCAGAWSGASAPRCITNTPSPTVFLAKVVCTATAIVTAGTVIAVAPRTVTGPSLVVLLTALLASGLVVQTDRWLARWRRRPGPHPANSRSSTGPRLVEDRARTRDRDDASVRATRRGVLGAVSMALLLFALAAREELGAVLSAVGLAALVVLRATAASGGWASRGPLATARPATAESIGAAPSAVPLAASEAVSRAAIGNVADGDPSARPRRPSRARLAVESGGGTTLRAHGGRLPSRGA